MKKAVHLLAIQLAGVAVSFGTPLADGPLPACQSNVSLAVYRALGPDGCSFAKVTFNSEQFDVTIRDLNYRLFRSSVTGVALPGRVFDTDIQVTAPTKLGDALGFFSNKFEVAAGQRLTFQFDYVIDPPPSVIPGYETDIFTETPVFPGYALYKTELCAGGIFGGSQGCVDLLTDKESPVITLESFYYTKSTKQIKTKSSITFDKPTYLVSVRNTLILDGGPKDGAIDPDTGKNVIGKSQISGVQNTVPTAVPEPMGLMLVGGGLALLAFVRRHVAR